ncbi:-alpha-glucan branching protein : Putative 1,4-alpha-glucan branching enzyme OS=Candidatus Competibacter denitrificans Run_A_D11 GN=BN873_630010 PE=4 SV=1: CBM_48: Alpha-amylase: Alpha-amylase_C [Gemmataceae bacterium]|nr:-alpha-glucan branching protein : Putative 1,4-alpha-glucan branching enzyme OS=Candidatus Competibacter denitrificans Run_A_D11 GN=BN873_630010 PE=4 SV=1: CBM_48: Alpha-amylase: Alpha-amylase_C [Gemmataceae bacterium]VTT97807.1 -alpha-glucan branching protein : Putative 1,4-alpha-glucan branching enzyme OS=Candidatus Competibacter denitrificans Run_A_D11 GN=BN873_630010 PE=4 SV=1: CBM_48: Alpha-amylase: Alpha-amylase_C [Gemmataceae bacterium]
MTAKAPARPHGSIPYPAGAIAHGRHSEAPAARPGMGAIPHGAGVAFRVWAPHAEAVSVTGTFNNWDGAAHPLARENPEGYWYADVPGAKVGDEYRYLLKTPAGELSKIDPYAREVTNSVGNAVVHDPEFDWGEEYFKTPPWNEWVIYELHVGTFNDEDPNSPHPGTFDSVVRRFDHLKRLGVNCIQVMPVAEFAGDRSWGYNPAHIFAVESAYGGPRAFKNFIRAAHRNGFAVILDVVYNHFGPSDLDLWQFDGWSENGGGGIYFYQDWRKETPWGDTRPDYGRPEVRQFIRDNAMMWVEDYHVDGLRMDMTLYIRSVRADGDPNLPDGWTLLQWINGEMREKHPNTLTVAEDLQHSDWMTKPVAEGGAGYGSQWDDRFVHPIREAVIAASDEHRSMAAVADAITHRYNEDAFQRVIYSESHDEVANGKARIVHEIAPGDPKNWFAQKRSTLAAALVFTAPGIPMLFQGQEFLEGEWFRDTVPLDWDKQEAFRGIVRLYRDLVRLRLNRGGQTKGLTGQHVQMIRVDDANNVVAFRRWMDGGPGDDVVVFANFDRNVRENFTIGFPAAGAWKLLFNSDWAGYSSEFKGYPSGDVTAEPGEFDGLPAHGSVNIGAYSVLVFAQVKG